MRDYTIFYKMQMPPNRNWGEGLEWDLFISAFNESERVRTVFDTIKAHERHWMVLPEYGFTEEQLPQHSPEKGVYRYLSDFRNESDYLEGYFDSYPRDYSGLRICVDITGFMRPHLLTLLWRFMLKGVRSLDVLYSEPKHYKKKEQTQFSNEVVMEVRQVSGFEGNHIPDTSNDLLIIGTGYDHELIAQVAESKENTRKIQLFGFPPLRADMYQENVLRAHRASESVGHSVGDDPDNFFVPANDPFVTANVLHDLVDAARRTDKLSNLYLSPLGTKVQALGSGLYYLWECSGQPVSIIFPFSEGYSQETSTGISRIWRYIIELPEQ